MERKQSFSKFQQAQKQNFSLMRCTENQSSYILGQALSSSENSRLEFKNYQWPFASNKNKDLELTLLKTICSLLNRDGGTILIGVSDTKKVEGVQVDNIDEIKRYFDSLKERFYPKPQGLIKTVELPIRKFIDEEQYFWIPNVYVIRIEVKQGKVDRFYTFKNGQQTLSAFREDASAIIIKDIDEIQEQIYLKSQHPLESAKQLIYEEADQEGLQESSNANQSAVHENKGNYIIITNIYKKYIDDFITFLDARLKERNLNYVEFFQISEYAILLTHQRMMKLYYAIDEISTLYFREIKKVTVKYQELQFGFPKKSLTVKVQTDEEQEMVIEAINELQCQGKIKEQNGFNEIFIYNLKTIDDLASIFQYFKDLKLQAFITQTKPEKKSQ